MSRRTRAFDQTGMAVIAALLVVIAAAVVTTRIIEQQGLLARTLASERERAQAAWMMRGGLDWSRAILRFDARANATTRLDAIWAQPLVGLPVGPPEHPERALFSGQAEDEQGKLNLNGLATDGHVETTALRELARLFEFMNIEPEVADNVAQRVAAAQYQEDQEPTMPGLLRVSDLATVPGMAPPVLARVSPFLAVLPEATQVNVNTASAEVLAAVVPDLDIARAREVVLERDRGVWFNNVGDFVNRLQLRDASAGQRLTVQSQWFRVSGEVAGDQTLVAMQGLVHRAGQEAAPTVRWISY